MYKYLLSSIHRRIKQNIGEKMIEDDTFRKAFSHMIEEIDIPNVAISLQKSDFEKVRKAHDSIHEFMLLPVNLINSDDEFHKKSGFLFYQTEAFDHAHRSFLEALFGYYNAAYILLRNTLELLIKGAFWECMAHKKYRDRAEVVKNTKINIGNSKKTLLDWINEIIGSKPSIENELERISGGIFDKVSPLFEDEKLRKVIPHFKSIIEQLAAWNIFDPIQEIDPVKHVYNFYKELSADIHVVPDKTNIGRRLLAEKKLFEIEVMPEELNKYVETLHKVMDIGIVVELNILEDLIMKNKKSKKYLYERLFDITELKLNYASTKIVEIAK